MFVHGIHLRAFPGRELVRIFMPFAQGLAGRARDSLR